MAQTPKRADPLQTDIEPVDAYMLWLWFRATGSGMDGAPFPRCADHARRTEQRPSVMRDLMAGDTEGLTIETILDYLERLHEYSER